MVKRPFSGRRARCTLEIEFKAKFALAAFRKDKSVAQLAQKSEQHTYQIV
jgi:hypothetical protein